MPIVDVLDACVLYPYHLRDFLIRLAINGGLYQPRWSEDIHDEWTRNLLKNRPDLDKNALSRTVELMNKLPGTLISKKDYSSLISGLELPDIDDRHILAAAINCNANYIVTFNLKDFPEKVLKKHKVEAIHPDDFVVELIGSVRESVVLEIEKQCQSMKNPPMTKQQLIKTLSGLGLKKSMNLALE